MNAREPDANANLSALADESPRLYQQKMKTPRDLVSPLVRRFLKQTQTFLLAMHQCESPRHAKCKKSKTQEQMRRCSR